jgi:NitT/TauT family transport system permease protein
MKTFFNNIGDGLIRSSGLVVFLVLWEIAPRLGWSDAQFLPPLSIVLKAVGQLWQDGVLYTHLMVSLWRALLGLLLSVAIALPLAFILEGWFPKTSRRLDPLFRLLSHINPFSLAPVFILFFGIGELEKLAIITLVALWPVLFHTITGIRTVDPLFIKTAHSLNVSKIILARDVLLPGALPTIITGLRVGTQMAVFMLVAAEMLGASAGLGWLVHNSAMMYQIPRMYAGGMFIIFIGICINKIILRIEKNSLFWKNSIAVLDQTDTKESKKISSFYVPVMTGVIAGIIFFGGQEVRRVNSQGLHRSNNVSHHNHSVDANKVKEIEEIEQHPPNCNQLKDNSSNHGHVMEQPKQSNQQPTNYKIADPKVQTNENAVQHNNY